jgi:hypothetical protein
MQQLRLSLPSRDPSSPFARLLFGLIALVLGVALLALVVFVILPLVGIIVSAALGGVLLAVAGVVMMIPFLLLAATVLVFYSRSNARRHADVRTSSVGR